MLYLSYLGEGDFVWDFNVTSFCSRFYFCFCFSKETWESDKSSAGDVKRVKFLNCHKCDAGNDTNHAARKAKWFSRSSWFFFEFLLIVSHCSRNFKCLAFNYNFRKQKFWSQLQPSAFTQIFLMMTLMGPKNVSLFKIFLFTFAISMKCQNLHEIWHRYQHSWCCKHSKWFYQNSCKIQNRTFLFLQEIQIL